MPSVFITGANRGLGLEFVKQYALDGWKVFACCRDPQKAKTLTTLSLKYSSFLEVHRMDVTKAASIKTLAKHLANEPIDLLINNAGVLYNRSWEIGSINYKTWEQTIAVNLVGATRVLEAFSNHVILGEGKQMVTISSQLASITHATSNSDIAYRASKAAINMVVKCVADALKDHKITCVAVSPGWVQTDMGTLSADLTTFYSVKSMRTLLSCIGLESSGNFLNYDGNKIAW